jgi:7-cyano-7-deazaguanine synthase in queuosine biosynthesis
MTRALFRCDGAVVPPAWTAEAWTIDRALMTDPAGGERNLAIEDLSHALFGQISERALDLASIAAYVYAADQLVRRGGRKDVYGEHWRRTMALVIPVAEPDFWNAEPLQRALSACLEFVSDDLWRFHFVKGAQRSDSRPLDLDKTQLHDNPDRVVLFSGGTDSLCAAILAASEGGRPALVSHESHTGAFARQKRLAGALRERCGANWQFPQVGMRIHRSGSDAVDFTQRSRPFLFASLGAAVAHELSVPVVSLPDNGFVSINPPINDQLVGALASRSTHPKFIRLFNDLVQLVFPEVRVSNPLWQRTRGEVLSDALRPAGAEDLLGLAVSCAHTRLRPRDRLHCGVCSQCIDRRFATIGAGLEAYDPATGYGIDIFRDALMGDARTLVLSYYAFGKSVDQIAAEDLFLEHPTLIEAVGDVPDAGAVAADLADLLRRHARNTITVIEEQIQRARAQLARQSLSPDSLLRLILGSPTAVDRATSSINGAASDTGGITASGPPTNLQGSGAPDGQFQPSDDYLSVRIHGQRFTLTSAQACIVKRLHDAWQDGTVDVSQHSLLEHCELNTRRLRDVFRRDQLAFRTLIRSGQRKGTFRLNLPHVMESQEVPT